MFNLYNHIFSAFRFLHPRQNHVFCFSRKTVSGIFSHGLWKHSEHIQHCAILYLEFLWAIHGVLHEQNISTVWVLGLHLTTRCLSLFGNGAIFLDVKHFIKCGLRAAKSYVELDGSSPNPRLAANTIENRPQSTRFFCCYTGMTWIIDSFSRQNEYAAIW